MSYKRLIKTVVVASILVVLFSKVYNFVENRTAYVNMDNEGGTELNQQVDYMDESAENKTLTFVEEAQPVFLQEAISEDTFSRINGVSWKSNSPVGIEDLKYITVTYLGFDDKDHIGEIIVHKELAREVMEIFEELYEAKFPIERIRLIDEYNANDDLSMEDNNTSAFCFREVTGNNSVLSNHSYGIAIDINPVQNPYVKGEIILPSEGSEYLDRENIRKGMIVRGDVAYKAFTDRGWSWGGDWNSLKDYQHFEKNNVIE